MMNFSVNHSLPRSRGRARVGAFVAELLYPSAPIPAFPRSRGKETSSIRH
ncbi:MAG: hypothetical protein JWQ90_1962 [Hydrocarboniphaga sp.]|nr:hypothetical protein [Hydrocarboniphaga sp.]